ncbi:probable CCR4-associated factor 1 homolog 6 [Nymphaea colorata]|uniref:probable CCR4-associated factor 1 homolog 6 n=1 Tax=Nymphaea colorata TaxID=210225 RepID=UPI00129E8302|nr:probable CCR4-associated factor 1 homolog 6 [Nymphaea colorata]
MSNNSVVIKSVWKDNFDAEMRIIRERTMIDHPFISLTTRLLLCSGRIPPGNVWNNSDINYGVLLQINNVFRNIVQVGVALCDKLGRLPHCNETGRPCIWEFNLMPVDESANNPEMEGCFLDKFCSGVKVEQLRSQGIHPERMAAELLHCSSLMKEKISWVVFKGALDFAVLLRWTKEGAQGLPDEQKEFFKLLAHYFPVFYDMAAVIGFDPTADDGTIDISAKSINVWREDVPPHGAASDSFLALQMFMRMKMLKKGCALLEKKARVLYGITSEQEVNAVPTFNKAPF